MAKVKVSSITCPFFGRRGCLRGAALARTIRFAVCVSADAVSKSLTFCGYHVRCVQNCVILILAREQRLACPLPAFGSFSLCQLPLYMNRFDIDQDLSSHFSVHLIFNLNFCKLFQCSNFVFVFFCLAENRSHPKTIHLCVCNQIEQFRCYLVLHCRPLSKWRPAKSILLVQRVMV